MNDKLKEILDTKVPEYTAALWWLGQMGLMVKIGKTLICVDYFATPGYGRLTPPPIPAGELTGIDAFLGTHDHLDHIDHEAWKIFAKSNPQAKFIFPRAHEKGVLADGVKFENAIGLNAGESVRVGDITIHAVAAAHEFLDRDPDTGLYPYLQYIIEGNCVRIHHAGDTVRYEGMLPAVTQYGVIDASLLPINGRDAKRYLNDCIGNMTYQEAADFAGESGTGIVIPGHWDMFADNSEDPNLFRDYISAKYKEKSICHIPKVMERMVISSR
ncbi:MAG: MBL fold metallo-hydrolase [Lachnospiraceae bacterium]|nr:MBL fold metallo-hydrolase [Lachnospiraceae bacterium]